MLIVKYRYYHLAHVRKRDLCTLSNSWTTCFYFISFIVSPLIFRVLLFQGHKEPVITFSPS